MDELNIQSKYVVDTNTTECIKRRLEKYINGELASIPRLSDLLPLCILVYCTIFSSCTKLRVIPCKRYAYIMAKENLDIIVISDKVVAGKQYLYLNLLGGRAFIDHLSTNSGGPHQCSFIVHVALQTQR